MGNKVSREELRRIQTIAYRAYGYKLTVEYLLDIVRLTRGMKTIVKDNWPPRKIMRDIASDHSATWWQVKPV